MSKRAFVGFALVVTVVIGGVLVGEGLAGGRKAVADLTGAAEVPGPGDSDGTGTAKLRLNDGKTRVCWKLDVANITTPSAAHIHRGEQGVAGDIVVTLFGSPSSTPTPAAYPAEGCVKDVPKALVKEIRKKPAGFYVNVHNADFPNGAIRGQLRKTN